jgi:hypothetical protein
VPCIALIGMIRIIAISLARRRLGVVSVVF